MGIGLVGRVLPPDLRVPAKELRTHGMECNGMEWREGEPIASELNVTFILSTMRYTTFHICHFCNFLKIIFSRIWNFLQNAF